ncbi:ornithine cyclodeaminase family protein [Comamonas aquatica]|uniref:ornithine cyclodeaminase family protein n=1 Tax=Comamonas aquatica TaxID=225991 RepID=UPI00244B03AA|nr:ornithine cyclodeaminase family protein [Comamonas aquatica]MDH1816103.1 ornithine cyclodeaminase family protein [Comamonas aquatica]
MQILTQPQTEHHLPFTALLPALEQMFTTGCEVPLRHHHAIPGRSTDEDGILLLMPAWQTGQRLGVKTVSIFPGNAHQGLPGLHSVYILYDARTGQPMAVLDGDTITSRRTAAASALAARWLSRPDARRLLVVGSGRVARLLPAAYRCVRALDTVEVWSRSPASAQALVDDLRAQGLPAQHAPDLEAAVRRADIVSCATLSTAPLIQGAWLQPGTHLDLIGSFTPAMRESDGECLRRATVFTDTTEALLKAGDLLGAIAAGAWSTDRLAATLEQLCRQQHPGRRSADEITLFKSVGSALEDLAAACLAYDGFRAG